MLHFQVFRASLFSHTHYWYAQEADTVREIRGAHGRHETAEVRDVRRIGGGRGQRGGQEKEWMGFLLDDLRAFGIKADQWTTGAQDEGE